MPASDEAVDASVSTDSDAGSLKAKLMQKLRTAEKTSTTETATAKVMTPKVKNQPAGNAIFFDSDHAHA